MACMFFHTRVPHIRHVWRVLDLGLVRLNREKCLSGMMNKNGMSGGTTDTLCQSRPNSNGRCDSDSCLLKVQQRLVAKGR